MGRANALSSYYEKFLATGEVKCINEEIPFEIPSSWEWCKLSNVIELLSGQDFIPEKYNSNNKGVPYITGASNIVNGDLVINRWTETPTVIGKLGDLLIVCKGSGVGKMCICNVDRIHIARQIQIIRNFSNLINLSYIKSVVEANLQTIISNAQGVIPGISREHILDLLIPVPPINEQCKIDKKLQVVLPVVNRYAKSQEVLKKLNVELPEGLKKSILQEAIRGRLVPQISEEGTAEELLAEIRKEKERLVKDGKLKKSVLTDSVIFKGDDNKYYEQIGGKVVDITDEIPFEIPDTWTWARIGILFAHNNGKQLNKSNSSGRFMEYITTSNLYWDGFKLDNLKKMPFEKNEIERCQAIKGDLLVCEGGDVGRACIWEYDFPIMLQNHIHKLRAYYPLCTKYFYYIFYLYNKIGIIGGKGIGIQGFSAKALHNTLVPLPPFSEQKRICSRISELFGKIKA